MLFYSTIFFTLFINNNNCFELLEKCDDILLQINNICLEISNNNNFPKLNNMRNIKAIFLRGCFKINFSTIFNNLEYLNINQSRFESNEFQNIFFLKNLKILIIPDLCYSLVGIENLKYFKYLYIGRYDKCCLHDEFFNLNIYKFDFTNNIFFRLSYCTLINNKDAHKKFADTIFNLMKITTILNLKNNLLSGIEMKYPKSHIYSLNLSCNNLTRICDSILNLKDLRILNLDKNDLTGVPPFFSMMKLEQLSLASNRLEIVHINIMSLNKLFLNNNKKLTRLKIERSENMKSFGIDLNSIHEIQSLDIEHLIIDCTELSDKPDLKRFPYLRSIHIHLSSLLIFPDLDFPLEELTISSVSYLKTKTAKKVFINLSKIDTLWKLTIIRCFIKIPRIISQLKSLKEIHMANNFVRKIPKNILKMPNLKYLNLNNNIVEDFNINPNKDITINLNNNWLEKGNRIYKFKCKKINVK
ncbi:Leucine rich repeat protein [Spraguea lophii 42_110]|uniref:Leucine rich repeat protein n=1 Tax=Spraguea lophii (strain 42_110) TaxID=1358809 RepID=S7XP39_SPRLO|nr:Leucine rich repeat protein [Spraguea lophii 42_110]